MESLLVNRTRRGIKKNTMDLTLLSHDHLLEEKKSYFYLFIYYYSTRLTTKSRFVFL